MSNTCCEKEIIQPIIKVARSTNIYKKYTSLHYGRKETTTRPQPQIEFICIKSERVQSGRTNASVTRTERSSSTVSQIYRTTQERAVLLSLGQFIEKVMQEFQKGLKEFMDKTYQLIFSLAAVVTKNMQWKENLN